MLYSCKRKERIKEKKRKKMKEKRKGKEAVNILIQISKINLKYTQNQNLE